MITAITSLTKVNAKSDINLQMYLEQGGVAWIPFGDFKAVFYTDGKRKAECGRIGTTFYHCDIAEDEQSLLFFIDSPRFKPGRLHCDLYLPAESNANSDGYLDKCVPLELAIDVINGPGDDVPVALANMKGWDVDYVEPSSALEFIDVSDSIDTDDGSLVIDDKQ